MAVALPAARPLAVSPLPAGFSRVHRYAAAAVGQMELHLSQQHIEAPAPEIRSTCWFGSTSTADWETHSEEKSSNLDKLTVNGITKS